jgi:hypothetical protein
MALFGLIGAWNYSAETACSAVGGSPRSGFEARLNAPTEQVQHVVIGRRMTDR